MILLSFGCCGPGGFFIARAAVQPHELALQRKLASPVAGAQGDICPMLKEHLRLGQMSAVLQPVELGYDPRNVNGSRAGLSVGMPKAH